MLDSKGSGLGECADELLLRRFRKPSKALRGIQMPTLSSPGLNVVCGLVAARKMLSGFRSPMNRSPFSVSLSASLPVLVPVPVRSDADPILDLEKMSGIRATEVILLASIVRFRTEVGVELFVLGVEVAAGGSLLFIEVCKHRFL